MSLRKVTNIVAARKRGYCFINYTVGESTLCSLDIVYECGIKKGDEISDELLHKVNYKQQLISIKQAALSFATYARRTEYQVRLKLKGKGYDSSLIDSAISFLYEFNYLSDVLFCEEFIKAKISRRYYGYERLKRELRNKGIEEKLAAEQINKWYPHDELESIALKSAEKKYRSINFRDKAKVETQIKRHLLVQGFSFDIIKKVCHQLFKA